MHDFKFGLGHRNIMTVNGKCLVVEIENQSLIFDQVVFFFTALFTRTSQYRPYSDEYFTYRERLGYIVVGTKIESSHRIVFCIAGCKEYDGDILRVTILFQFTCHGESGYFPRSEEHTSELQSPD